MNFRDILNATQQQMAADILSEENDRNNIDLSSVAGADNIDPNSGTRVTERVGGSGWDKDEWRTSIVDAKKMIETEDGRKELARRGWDRASLDDTTGKVAFFSVGQKAWHGLGKVISRAVSGTEALALAELAGWDLQKIPHTVKVDGQDVETGTYAIVRMDTKAVIGKSVGARYEIFRNEELAELLDAVMDYGAEVITGGATGQGEKVWLLAKMPKNSVIAEGDEVENYVLFCTSHDGSHGILALETGVRVECQNTYRNALKGSGRRISIRHTKNARTKVAEVKRALGMIERRQKEWAENCQELAAAEMGAELTKSYFEKCLDEVIDQTKVAGVRVRHDNLGEVESAIGKLSADKQEEERAKLERYQRRHDLLLDDITSRYNSETCKGENAWAAANAVNEHLCHSSLYQNNNPASERDPQTRQESRMASLTNGRVADLTDKVFELAAAQVK